MDDGDMEVTDWTQFWHDYRRTTGTLTWRLATPVDLPAIRRLRSITERFLGKPQRDLSLFRFPVLLALVAENERGVIVDCLFLEAQVEVVKTSCSRKGLEESAGLEEDLLHWLRAKGFRTLWVTTIPRLRDRMAQVLGMAGFKCLDGVMSVWRRRL
jgi:hypothetical protein